MLAMSWFAKWRASLLWPGLVRGLEAEGGIPASTWSRKQQRFPGPPSVSGRLLSLVAGSMRAR